jgi:arylsulfatase A-like enzyme
VVFYEQEESRGIRTPRFAYWKRLPGTGEEELYDMVADPGQLHNLAKDPAHAQTVRALDARLEAFFERYSDPRYDLWRGGIAKGSVIRPGMFRALYGPEWTTRTEVLEPFKE